MITFLTIIIFFYILEKYLIHFNSEGRELAQKKQVYEKEINNKYDTRSRIELYEDLRKLDYDVTLTVSPQNHFNSSNSYFPLSGISNMQTIHCNENGYYSTYESDRYGFNNPDEEWESSEIEYLLVGDSFTHGACVNRPNDISSLLRELSNKSVLNLGYGGNGPLIEYATLREYLSSNVKKVIWIYFEGNDLNDLNNEIKNKILNSYMSNSNYTQNLKNKQDELDNIIKKIIQKDYRQKFKFIKLTEVRKMINKIIFKKQSNLKNKNMIHEENNEIKKILKLAKNLTIKNNSEIYFVYLPSYLRYRNGANFNRDLVKTIVNELGIKFIDIHENVFKKEDDPMKLFPFSLNGHYNKYGYKKVAESIYKLTKN